MLFRSLPNPLIGKHEYAMLEEGEEDQNTRPLRGSEYALLHERLGRASLRSARQSVAADESARHAFEAARKPAAKDAELKPDQHPEMVERPPATEETRCKRRASRPQRASEECALPRDLRVRIAAFDHVHHELSSSAPLSIGRGGADRFAISVRKKGVDSACHSPR